jgi:hypothetical protein
MSYNTINWDPLKGDEDEIIVSAAKKRQIRNILKSYVSAYDPFSELIQNAMDAVDIRFSKIPDEGYRKRIWVKIDIKNNLLCVTDNGIGFNASEFKSFLAPNNSYKDGSKTRGHKGVGATYIAFGFNYLQMGTKTPEYKCVAEIQDGRIWVDDNDQIITKPFVKESQRIHPIFDTIDRGSTFTVKFGGDNVRPKSLNYFVADQAEQWFYILLVKTPLGNIDFFNSNPDKILFNLEVIDGNGKSTVITDTNANYIYPHLKISASADLKEILVAKKKLFNSNDVLGSLPAKFKRLNGIYEYFTSEELKLLPTEKITQDDKELIDKYQVTAYGFFCYSTDIWDELNDKVIKLRQGTRLLRGGLQLANNFMPQGELIAIPLTSNIGYQNQTHVIVHFLNADPDLGRKGFQPELKELGENLAYGMVNKFKKWRSLLRIDTGARPDLSSSDDVWNWVTNQVSYETNHPLKITNPNFFAPMDEISITSIPQSEQDVIVLFNQLLAGGVIRGLKLLATDQKKQYDGVFKYFVKEPIINHVYDKILNPLGVDNLQHSSNYISRPWILEYKFSVDALLREFENGEKHQDEINLIIAWETGDSWMKSYEVTSLLQVDNLHHRPFHGLTHIFRSGNSKFYAIILSELVEYLNDFEQAQVSQKEKYEVEL